MPVTSAFVLPHPPLIVPEVGRGQETGISDTVTAYRAAADAVYARRPDTIAVISPHSVMYADYIHISPGESASGTFSRFGAGNVRFSVQYDTELAKAVEEAASARGIPAGGLGERDASLDHGTMVPLYFLRQPWGAEDAGPLPFKILRISISGLSPAEHYIFGMCIAQAAEKLGRNIVVAASGDLSHKLQDDGPYGFADEGPRFDRHVIDALAREDFLALMRLEPDFCEAAAECGLRSFVTMAGALDRKRVEADLMSYEGPFGVGYAVASFKVTGDDPDRNFLDKLKSASAAAENEGENAVSSPAAGAPEGSGDPLVSLARRSLETFVKTGKRLPLPEGLPAEITGCRAGCFVTLKKFGELRGCIGTIAPTQPTLAEEVLRNAVSSGTEDNRFRPVTLAELPDLTYSVDVLSPAENILSPRQLDVKRYGVIVTKGWRRGLLLPNLEGVDTVERQISIALSKAGISEDENYALERFEVVRHK